MDWSIRDATFSTGTTTKVAELMKRLLKKAYRLLCANRACYKLNTFLFECSLHGLGVLNYENDRLSGEATLIEHTLRKFLGGKRNPVFIDVGANVGDYSRKLQETYPDSRVVSIEPHPTTFNRLRENLSDRVETLNIGLGAAKGELTLFDVSDCDGSCYASLYEDVITELRKQEAKKITVQIETLDDITKRLDISSIDLLKIDAEGHELEILKGATSLLASESIPLIHFEFNEMNIISRVFLRDFRQLLGNFSFFRLLPRSMIEIREQPLKSELFAYQNVLCVRHDLAEASSIQ